MIGNCVPNRPINIVSICIEAIARNKNFFLVLSRKVANNKQAKLIVDYEK
jgi:hypothetical protein